MGHAAAFNRLDRYPDDANFEFDFGFRIRSVVAIAPVDGQYLPTGRHVPIENVNYMVFHGSHDGDVTSFHGLRQYKRLSFTDGGDYFKTAIYMYRANHGQWNSVWNNKDNGPRSGRILELSALVDPEEQREMGKIYISAFLEATLHDDKRYLPLFRDHRVIGEWLPNTMYITRFESSTFRPIATFDEDIDVTTGTAPGVTLLGDSLGSWREDLLALRSRNRPTTSNSQQSNAVWLGWNNEVEGGDGDMATPASYTIGIPAQLGAEWQLDEETTLDFLLTALDEKPGPRDRAEEEVAKEDTTDDPLEDEDEAEDEPVNLSIEIADAQGQSASVPLSAYGPIRKPLSIKVRRRNDSERFGRQWEMVLQSYSIPLEDFVATNGRLDLSSIRQVRLVFDRTSAGTVVVDNIGFSKLDAAFFETEE